MTENMKKGFTSTAEDFTPLSLEKEWKEAGMQGPARCTVWLENTPNEGPFFVLCKMRPETLLNIKSNLHIFQKKFADKADLSIQNRLAGNIKKEFSFVPKEIQSILGEELNILIQDYSMSFGNKKPKQLGKDYNISTTWVNYQKKYEFNPPHSHTANLSFVSWISIPYDINEELSLDNCKYSNKPSNSIFEFIWGSGKKDRKIRQHPLFISKEWEGTIVLFDSNLSHTVYPFFTSDGYRISMSGNLAITGESPNFDINYE